MIRVGSVIGNYTIVSKLGEGAMATVFLAEHPRIGKRVAIKVIHPELSTSQEMVSRFFTEARAVSQIHHAHVVDIQDFGQTPDGDNFIIMEYLEGETLAARLAELGRLDAGRTVRIALQVCEGLQVAHGRGVIHRDLKPDNIFLCRRGNDPDFVKILDYGLAKLTGGPALVEAQHRTRTGSVLGTPHYMAPEQCEGKTTVDGRADIYSLGCIIYQLLAGELPFPGDGFGEVLVKHLREAPPPLRPRNPEVSPALEKVVLHCLAKKREFRFQSVEELTEALTDPERFSAQIGDDRRRIAGPLPGETFPGTDTAPPPQAPPPPEPPPTLIGDMNINATLLAPPPASSAQQPAVAVAEQRTVIGEISPFAQQPGQKALAEMETLTGAQGPPPVQPPARGGRTMIAEPLPGDAGWRPEAVPVRSGGTMLASPYPSSQPTLPPSTRSPYAYPVPKETGRQGTSRLPVIIGALAGLLVVVAVISLPLLRPRVYEVTVTSIPERAQVLRDGQLLGETPWVLHIKKGDPDVRLVLRKSGFVDSVRQLHAAQAAREPIFAVKLLPRPPAPPAESGDDGGTGTPARAPEDQAVAHTPPGPGKPERQDRPDRQETDRTGKPRKNGRSGTHPGKPPRKPDEGVVAPF